MFLELLLLTQLTLLLLLSLFALHRLWFLSRYFAVRDKRPIPASMSGELPTVTIQLPLYNEWETATRLIRAVTALEYPKEKIQIQILDDSTIPECRAISKANAAQARALGFDVELRHRSDRIGFKAGALEEGLATARGEFVAIFDADFTPSTHFLISTLPYFQDQAIDLVQCRWTHSNANANALTRAQAALLDGHFQIEHTVRNRSGVFFNFNGTAGIWRKSAINKAGGWQGDTLTEDLDLSYRAQLAGSRFVYLLEQSVPGELPTDLNALRSQQHRWTKGAIEVLCKLGPQLWSAAIPPRHKFEAFMHLGSNFCYPLLLCAGLLVLPTVLALDHLQREDLSTAILVQGSYFFGFLSLVLFYVVAVQESRHERPLTCFYEVVLALLTGIGLSLSNSMAVIEACLKLKSPFVRTPKASHGLPTGVEKKSKSWKGFLPALDLVLCFYFACTVALAIELQSTALLPFSILFLAAFSFLSYLHLNSFLRRLFIQTAKINPRERILQSKSQHSSS